MNMRKKPGIPFEQVRARVLQLQEAAGWGQAGWERSCLGAQLAGSWACRGMVDASMQQNAIRLTLMPPSAVVRSHATAVTAHVTSACASCDPSLCCPPPPPSALQYFPKADKGALRLLWRLLAFDPAERPTAGEGPAGSCLVDRRQRSTSSRGLQSSRGAVLGIPKAHAATCIQFPVWCC